MDTLFLSETERVITRNYAFDLYAFGLLTLEELVEVLRAVRTAAPRWVRR